MLTLLAMPAKAQGTQITIPADQPVSPVVIEVVAHSETLKDIIRRVAAEKQFNNPEILIRIAKCESNLNPKAHNPHSSATGLFQITSHGLSVQDREDPEFSVKWAIQHFDSGHPWDASRHCWQK